MRAGDICTKPVVVCTEDTSVVDAAKQMRDAHIGNVIVTERRDGREIPVGVVTDRDIVVQIVAKEVDPSTLRVGDIMSQEIYTVSETEPVRETIERMRFAGVRRLPVVDAQGAIVGIVALDDLLQQVAKELGTLAEVGPRARELEARFRGE